MSGMQYEFDDSKSSSRFLGNRRRNKNNRKSNSFLKSSKKQQYNAYNTSSSCTNHPTHTNACNATTNSKTYHNYNTNQISSSSAAAYHLGTNPSMDNTEDGSVSLTYSVSSSQAGESTDSSIADFAGLLQVEGEQQYHMLQQKQAQRMRNGGYSSTANGGGSARGMKREKSNCDSLGYSDDEDSVNYANWTTITGQPSDSFAHDGGTTSTSTMYKSSTTTTATHTSYNHNYNSSSSSSRPEPSPRSNMHKHKKSIFSPQSITADLHSCESSGTPNTPPPRPSSKKSLAHDTEVWYQKWWMCGFTDALNLNPKCLD